MPALAPIITLAAADLSWINLLGIAVGLASDAFAVSLAAGMTVSPITRRHTFRLAFHFGLFQFLMPILGWLAGLRIAPHVAAWSHWATFLLLAGVSLHMLWEAVGRDESASRADPTRGLLLVTLCVATSVDALAAGLSMALLGTSIWLPAVVTGVLTALLSAGGITFGGHLGPRWGKMAEIGGGLVLLAIGLRILVTH